MKTLPAVVAVSMLVVLLTWLSLHTIDSNAEAFDMALSDLDQFAMAEAALHRDVLAARAGLLRNYDPLVREIRILYDTLARLRQVGPGGEQINAAIGRLTESVGQLEGRVEQFKSDNALLQNSLAHFALVSTTLDPPGHADRLAPQISALSADMLHFILDTSTSTARNVQVEIEQIAAQQDLADNPRAVGVLLSQGRILLDLLPRIDGVLKMLSNAAEKRDRDLVRAIILDRQAESRATALRYRLLLYVTSLFLVALLIHLALQLGARARAIQRRGALEHVIAGISMRFINAEPAEIDAHIQQALADMAECVGADRAYFLIWGNPGRSYAWSRPGLAFPPGWPDQAPALAARVNPALEGIVYVPRVNRLPRGEEKEACLALGLRGWACASGVNWEGTGVVLGFDAVQKPSRITRPGELGLLRMALDIIVNAIRRQAIESEKMRLEARLQQTRRMETVGALASGIAHNFNNIVGAILGYVEMAQGHVAGASRSARYLEEIRRAGDRARDLIDQILVFGRRRDSNRRPVDVGAIISEAASLLRASLSPKIDLEIRDASESVIVSGDAVQLQQVILNLCTNAAQAMNGVGRVEVEVQVSEFSEPRILSHGELSPGRYVCIAVSDTGRGIDHVTLTRIFEPFFTTRLMGNGLGLATVREIVREHGGALNVQSEPGVGSRFEAWLNCIVEPAAREGVPTLPFGDGETLLLVDDCVERRLRDEEILAALGYEPIGFTHAEDAIVAWRAAPKRFDAFVVGHLAGANGALELASALHEVAPDVPILLLTESTGEIGVNILMAAGISEMVSRPLVAAEIAAALMRCLPRPGQHASRVPALLEADS
jgi:signal transduction histidine kinase/ActR/RegA family two-component response regulator